MLQSNSPTFLFRCQRVDKKQQQKQNITTTNNKIQKKKPFILASKDSLLKILTNFAISKIDAWPYWFFFYAFWRLLSFFVVSVELLVVNLLS